jgi:DNA-binding NtrC family response regulator
LIAEIKNFPITEGLTSGIPNNDLKGRIEDISGTLETVSPDDFASGVDLNRALEDYEKRLITHALTVTNGVKSQAAKFLNINRTTLIERMKRLGLGSTGDEHK